MMTVWISLGVAALTFAFGVAGLYLQRLLPAPHTSDRSRDMMHTAYVGRRAAMHRLAVLSREHGDEPAVAGIEIDVALVRIVEIGLLENEGHAEHALPEIDRCFPVGPRERDVVYTLALQLLHDAHLNSIPDKPWFLRAAPQATLTVLRMSVLPNVVLLGKAVMTSMIERPCPSGGP